MKADGLILAGGNSRRMGGRRKENLVYQNQTFLERILEELRREADSVWISYGIEVRREYPGCGIVLDEYPECGPIGGLHAGLKKGRQEWMMTAACDMPFIKTELYRYLDENLQHEEKERKTVYYGAVPVTGNRAHPLAALYRKSFGEVLKAQIHAGNYRLKEIVSREDILKVDVTGRPEFRRMLTNVNTEPEYKALMQGGLAKQKIIAVCGIKNSGKTTLLARLVRELSGMGYRVAVIKHDGHDFTCDIPGTDSDRLLKAGAYGTAVYAKNRTFIHKLGEPDTEGLIRQFPEADVIFIEGMKESRYPKIELVRKGISDAPVSNPEGRFLLVTDWEPGRFSEPSAGFDETGRILGMILDGI